MDRGFTLLEVLVALVILSISFLWLLSAENQGIDMAIRSRFLTTSSLSGPGAYSRCHLRDTHRFSREQPGGFWR